MSFLIASGVGSNTYAGTGRSTQNHLVYAVNQGAYWVVSISSTQSLIFAYSTNSGASWSTPSGSPVTLVNIHRGLGDNFGFYYLDGSNDVFHMCSNYITGPGTSHVGSAYHSRFTLGTTLTQTNSETIINSSTSSLGTNIPTTGCVTAVDSGGIVTDISSLLLTTTGDAGPGGIDVARSANSDSGGSSWTGGFNGPWGVTSNTYFMSSSALIPLSSGKVLAIGDNAVTSGTYNQLNWSVWNGSTWSTAGNVFSSSVTTTSTEAWGVCKVSSTDIHVVSLSDNYAMYTHMRFNGTSWISGGTIPDLVYGTNSGISLISDGTNVYMAVIDSDSENIFITEWTPTGGWGGWILQENESNTASYITGCYSSTLNQFMWAWQEVNGANNDIRGSLLSLTPQNIFSSDSSSSSDYSLNYKNSSDYSTSTDSFQGSMSIFTTDTSCSYDTNLISQSFIFAESYTSSENYYKINIPLSQESGSVPSEQYELSSGITDTYSFNADYATSIEGQLISSIYYDYESYTEQEASLLSLTNFYTDSASQFTNFYSSILNYQNATQTDTFIKSIFSLPTNPVVPDLTTGLDNQYLTATILQHERPPIYDIYYLTNSFIFSESYISNDSFYQITLPSLDSSTQSEQQYKSILISDNPPFWEQQFVFKSIYQTDFIYSLENNFISQSIIFSDDDQASAMTNQLSINFPSQESAIQSDIFIRGMMYIESNVLINDQAIAYDNQSIFILPYGESLSSSDQLSLKSIISLVDSASYATAILKSPLSSDISTDINQNFLLSLFFSASCDAAAGSESFLIELTLTDSASEHNTFISSIVSTEYANPEPTVISGTAGGNVLLESHPNVLLESGYPLYLEYGGPGYGTNYNISYDSQFLIKTITFTEDYTACDTHSNLSIIFGCDMNIQSNPYQGSDSNLPTPIPIYPQSTNSIVDVMYSIIQVINNSGVVGPMSADYIVNLEDIKAWPVNPPPLILVQPSTMTDVGSDVGSGRFGKLWDVEFIIHLVVTNYLDQAWKDTSLVTSYDPVKGLYPIADAIINVVDQCFPVNALGQPTVVELPQFLKIDDLMRYTKSQGYVGLPIRFRLMFQEILPLNQLEPPLPPH